ncbi:MAG: (E)-4-hydroxy-3-methylbut-2-enyl-diphosphate synthase [Crocinitomicaceae bacterium]
MNYCESYTNYKRFLTREVKIGNIIIGGKHSICLQSMTTKDTMNTEASIAESIRMIDAGCELVRITAPSKKEAENLALIQKGLREKGYTTPLVADIHFTPNAAEIAATIVDKVRINPGNFADKKRFETHIYTEETYQAEINRIEKKFTPFVRICKENKTAMRIGVNHGSLSDRILSRFGDTPRGMVESAMEFIHICEKNDYFDIVLSMKASNPQVMVQAYRLLVATMKENNMNYPLHLGVTEAGEGEDGRIKSAIGIGALLEDGLGDTIRVSLTEAPEKEIPVARIIAERYEKRINTESDIPKLDFEPALNPYSYTRRESTAILNCGGKQVPVVIADLSHLKNIKPAHLYPFGYNYSIPTDKWTITDASVDYIYIGDNTIDFQIPGTLSVIQNLQTWLENGINKKRHYPIITSDLILSKEISSTNYFVSIFSSDLAAIKTLKNTENKNCVIILQNNSKLPYHAARRFMFELEKEQLALPVIYNFNYSSIADEETFLLNASTDNGSLFLDGFGDGIMLTAPNASAQLINRVAFGILQATRTRIYKTEYISCPSCGRTLFDLEETTKKIREKTHHLKGLKIAVMGCIVNGPGEMADADYGYVGSGTGKVSLYKEKEMVKKSVDEANAVNELILLIKENGDWVEPV